jgi:hypothetical protein
MLAVKLSLEMRTYRALVSPVQALVGTGVSLFFESDT